MKRILIAPAIALAIIIAPLAANAGVGVAINIGAPNYYGEVPVANRPPPAVVYRQPVVIQPRYGAAYAPVYLRVPPRHHRHWNRYCGQYNACGRPVYFVNDNWYRNNYRPRHYEPHHRGYDHHR